MPVIQRIKKPTTRKGKQFLVDREPKLIENLKKSLFLNGRKTSERVTSCLRDLYNLKKPDGLILKGKHDYLPFEDVVPLEGIAKKYDSSLFAFASHSKKRPDNIILGRMYDNLLLDMIELGIDNYKSMSEFDTEKIPVGLKPCILFAGPIFEQNTDFQRYQNLFVDFFHREKIESVRLQGLEHVIMITGFDNKLLLRSYRILLKKSGTTVPRVELEEIGPSIDFTVRRTKLASEDLFKLACKKPGALKAKKVKNIRRDAFGSKLGRVHVKQQSISSLQTRKMKGLKKTPEEKKAHRVKRREAKRAQKS